MEKDDAVRWRRSSRCSTSACVEVARVPGAYLIRDAKKPNGPVLSFTEEEWLAFAAGVADGEFRF